MGNKLTTVWGENINPDNILKEYPRPQMERESYINLNGCWDFAVTNNPDIPEGFAEQILVPFAPEAPLSGINRVTKPDDYIWYRRVFKLDASPKASGEKLLIHFGAVDQFATLFINGKKIGTHKGGYTAFSFDITEVVCEGENSILLCVRDLTDTTWYARGKQKLEHSGMYYTPISGIWQTVWMERVPSDYVSAIKILPELSRSRVDILLAFNGQTIEDEAGFTSPDFRNPISEAIITVYENSSVLGRYTVQAGEKIKLWIPGFHAWTPEDPFLYTYELTVGHDKIKGYFAFREFGIGTDDKGVPRLLLNGKPYFHNGLLDQGYWPDGLYTAPSDEALAYDIVKCKELGFNMLRKHAKIEPLRWYYHCDRLGMLVWQDIVNGGSAYNSNYVTYMPTIIPKTQTTVKDINNRHLSRNSQKSKDRYITELKETIGFLYNCPCIAVWVLFNEGWGQFNSAEALKLAKSLDSTRTFDHASGWFDQGSGDLKSLHIYFTSFKIKPENRPVVISEFGGYALPTPGHMACDKVYGYRKYSNQADFTNAYDKLYREKILPLIETCLCGAVYTQVSDIEDEINGLLTYDRKMLKIDEDTVRKINALTSYDSFNQSHGGQI